MERMMAQSTVAASAAAGAGPKTERLFDELRNTPLFRQLVPMEAGIGWPIPLRRDGRVYVTLPLFSFGTGASGGKQIQLYPPFASVTLNWATQRPVKYVTFRFEAPWTLGPSAEPVGIFPHDAIAKLSIGAYTERRKELLGLYDELCESLAGKGAFTAERSARFSELLRQLIEPSLEPFYRTLGPKFFERFLPAEK